MKRALASTLIAALIWTSVPPPAWAQLNAAGTQAAAAPAGGVPAAGVGALSFSINPIGSPLGFGGGSLASPTSLPGAAGLSLQPARASGAAIASGPKVAPRAAVAAASVEDVPSGVVAAARSEDSGTRAVEPGGGSSLKRGVKREVPAAAIDAPLSEKPAPGSVPGARSAVVDELKLLHSRVTVRTPDATGTGRLIGKFFDGALRRKSAAHRGTAGGPTRVAGAAEDLLDIPLRPAHESKESSVLPELPLTQTTAGTARRVKKTSLWQRLKTYPPSFYRYLQVAFVSSAGHEAAAVLTPLFAYLSSGIVFALTSQATALVGQLIGSFVGARLIKGFDSKKAYAVLNTAKAIGFLGVPLLFWLSSALSLPAVVFPAYLIAYKLLSGFNYGALRGVAEKEIMGRLIRRKSKSRLEEMGAVFYVSYGSGALTSNLVTAGLLMLMSQNLVAGLMGLVMLSSLIPLRRMKLHSMAEVSKAEAEVGVRKKLPWKLYLPFSFAFLVHMTLYDVFAPFLGLEVFGLASMGGLILGAFNLGSMLMAVLSWVKPGLMGKLSEKQWWAAAAISTLAFLWATLALQVPVLSLALAALTGMGVSAVTIQWRAAFQRMLSQEAQPAVFKWLSAIGAVAVLIAFGIIQGSILGLGLTPVAGLAIVVGVMTALAAGIHLSMFRGKGWRAKLGPLD